MSNNLHRLQVEITAEINKFKKKCDAVKTEAKKTVTEANESMSKIGAADFGADMKKQWEEAFRPTREMSKRLKQLAKEAQIEAGIIEPTNAYKALVKSIAAAEARLSGLREKQKAMPKQETRQMSEAYAECSEQVKKTEAYLDELIKKQTQWLDMGVDPKSSSAFQALDNEIEDVNKELQRYKRNQEEIEASGRAFVPTEKWKALQRQVTAAREEIKRYKAEEQLLSESGGDYQATDKMTEGQQYKSWATAVKRSFAGSLRGVIAETFELHPALERVMSLMRKFGNTAKSAGNRGKTALKAIQTTAKVASWPLRMLASGFGKVYQKIKDGISVLRRYTHQTNNLSNSCGKLLGRFGALRITATYMFASFLIMGGINAMKEGFKSLSQYSSRTNSDLSMLMSSLTQLRNSLATAFAPILSVVAPIISTFIDWLSAGMTAIAHFMAAITGQSQVVVARKASQDFAGGIAAAGSAADGAAESVENYKRSLMGFDQINKLDTPDSGSGSSGSGGGTSGGGAGVSDMFETVEVGSTFAGWAEKFKEAWESADFTEIGQIVGAKLNAALENIPWDKIKATSAKIAKSLATFLNGFISETDWKLVGSTFAEGLNTIIEFGHSFVTNFNWVNFGKAIGNAINGFFADLDLAKAGKTLSEGLKGILDTAVTALETVDWSAVAKKMEEFFVNIDYSGIASKIAELLGAALGGLASVVGTLIGDAFSAAKDYFGDKIDECGGNVIAGLLKGIGDALLGIGTWIVDNIFKPIINGFKSAFGINSPSTVMAEQGGFMMDGLFNGLKNGVDAVIEWFKDLPSKIKKAIGNMKDFVDAKFDVGISLVKKGWEKLKDWIGIKAEAFEQKIDRAKAWGTQKLSAFLGIGDTLEQKINRAKAWTNTIREFLGLTKDSNSSETQKISRGKGWSDTIRSFLGLSKKASGKKTQKIGRAKGWNTKQSLSSWIGISSKALKQKIGLKKGWSGTIKKWLGIDKDFKLKFNLPKIKVEWGEKKVAGFKIKYPTGFSTYAQGGFPEEGPFMMNRGEIAGKFSNGKGVVANNQQITTGIAKAVGPAVYSAMVSALSTRSDGNGNVTVVLEGDAKGLFKAVKKEADDYTRSTGLSPFPV